MKIKELWIENYKLLQDFHIDFESQTTVIIGKNGSGKSTIIEIISQIFLDLYTHFVLQKGKKPEVFFKLKYDIEYESNTYEIYITSRKSTKEYYEIVLKKEKETGKKYSKAEIEKEFILGYKSIFPQNVVVYYSGISEILKTLFEDFLNEHIVGSLDGEKDIKQPFYYFDSKNFGAILIGLLSFQYGDIPEILKTRFEIESFKEIKITLKKPKWAKNEDYWGAKGDLLTFLQRLRDASIEKNKSQDEISYTFVNKEQLEEVWEFYGEEKGLFKYLTSLQFNGLIKDIEIILNKDNELISYKQLSEGEKQYLITWGMKELLATQNSLFLFDEPDTYLHPQWQREYVEILKPEEKGLVNFLIMTHSVNIISGLKEGQLKVIQNIDGRACLKEISFKHYGKPVDLLLIDFFDFDGLRNIDVENKFRELRLLISENKYKTDEYNKLFDEMVELIGKDDLDLITLKMEIARKEKQNEKDK